MKRRDCLRKRIQKNIYRFEHNFDFNEANAYLMVFAAGSTLQGSRFADGLDAVFYVLVTAFLLYIAHGYRRRSKSRVRS